MATATTFEIGELVTITGPYDDLPYILSFRRHVRFVRRDGDSVMVELDSVSPDARYQVVPLGQVQHGWRDRGGRWL
jgi:hypothetical protein